MSINLDIFRSPLLDELEESFNTSLNQAWFKILAEGSQVDTSLLRQVEDFFIFKETFVNDAKRILEIVLIIETIVSRVRRFMLPNLRDRLRVSGFFSGDESIDPDTRIRYGFIAYAFPRNIERLSDIAARIKSEL